MVDITDVIEQIRSVLETNLTDPWESASGSTRTDFVFTNDIRLTGNFPKILIKPDPTSIQRVTWGKTTYRNKCTGVILIHFFNKRAQSFTVGTGASAKVYDDGGSNEVRRSLNQYYLKYIFDTLKAQRASVTAAETLEFGTISNTEVEVDVYYGFLPVTVTWIEGGS